MLSYINLDFLHFNSKLIFNNNRKLLYIEVFKINKNLNNVVFILYFFLLDFI